jgi:hypothetical protein
MLGAATLMLGTQANALDLLPATASIGLVKDVTLSAEPAFVNLTQGAKNTLVYSMLTMNNVKIAANVFEYTAKNLTYGLSLDGTGISAATAATTTTAAINGGTTPTLIVPMAAFGGAGFADGDTVMIQEPGSEDQILVRTIVSHATLDATVNATIKSNFSSGAIVTKVNTVPLGSTTTPPFLAAKIVGLMADNTPAVVVFPKVRISKGLTMAWNSEQFGSMPFELEVFDLLPADTLYASFPNRKANLYVS